ncbi:MAG: alpha/beta hydrolase [Flavobacteriaceae bacterium]|nr:alpha/beta hydrolase [Flavobacteriaceae bacterium]
MKKLVMVICMICALGAYAQEPKNMDQILKPYSYPTQFLEIDSVSVCYTDVGKGKSTLVFVHGLSSNLETWKFNIESLSKTYRCIALDLPGFGRSGKNATVYNATSFSKTILGLMDHLQLEKAVLVGHSMGGQASIKFAASYPDRVEKLVLVAPAGVETFSAQEGTLIKTMMSAAVVKATSNEQIDQNYKANFYEMPENASDMVTDRKNITKASDFEAHTIAIAKSISGMIEDPVFLDLPKIVAATLVVFGEKDYLIPNRFLHPQLSTKKVGELAVEKIPNAILQMIPAAGHSIQFEKPEALNNAIAAFLKE